MKYINSQYIWKGLCGKTLRWHKTDKIVIGNTTYFNFGLLHTVVGSKDVPPKKFETQYRGEISDTPTYKGDNPAYKGTISCQNPRLCNWCKLVSLDLKSRNILNIKEAFCVWLKSLKVWRRLGQWKCNEMRIGIGKQSIFAAIWGP